MKCTTGQRAKSSGSTSAPSTPIPSGAREGSHRLSAVALACLALFSIGCAGNNQKARWASQEVGCPVEGISTTEIRSQDGRVSYYATCEDGSSYECVTSRTGLSQSATSCDLMARAKDKQPSGSGAQTTVEGAFAREMGLPTSRQIAAADGRWVTAAPSLELPVRKELENNVTQVQFRLSQDLPVDCFFYRETLNAGAAVSAMMAEFSKTASLVQAEVYRVGEVSGFPVALVDTIYDLEKDDRKLTGSVKIGVSPRLDTSVVCVMDGLGYRTTFAVFMQRLLGELKPREQPLEPRLSEVWRYEMDGRPVGFEMNRLVDAADGTLAELTLSTLLLPVSPGEVSFHDSSSFQIIDGAGPVSGEYLTLENGIVHSQINLRRGRGRSYKSTGILQGKPFELGFVANERLASVAAIYAHMAKAAGQGGAREWLQYVPDLDPAEPLKVTHQLGSSGKSFTASVADLAYSGKRGKDGLPTRQRMALGERALDSVLIHRVGAP